MLTLLLETSTEHGLVALAQGEHLLTYEHCEPKKILVVLANLLADRPRLERLIVGVGPGSYTGTRIAVIVAKTMAYALKLPLISVSSLFGFIPKHQEGPFAAIIDAKIGGVYTLLGEQRGCQIHYCSEPALRPLENAFQELKAIPLLVTPNARDLRLRLETMQKWQWEERPPDAQQLLTIGEHYYEQGRYSKDCNVDILYLRRTQAEIERGLL